MKGRQSIRAGVGRVQRQLSRNVRYGFPQRGRYCSIPGQSITCAVIVLPLTKGHREWSV